MCFPTTLFVANRRRVRGGVGGMGCYNGAIARGVDWIVRLFFSVRATGSLRHTLRIRFCNHCTNSSARRIFRAHSTWNTLRRTKAKEESLERGTRHTVFEIQPFPTESEGEAFARYSQRLRFEPALWNSVNGGIRTCSVWHNGTIVVQSTVPYVGRVMARKSDPQTSFLDLL